MEQIFSSSTRERVVFDWNNIVVGTVKGDRRDPKTHELRGLDVILSDDAQSLTGAKEKTVTIPASYIFGLRRDQVTLNRSFDEIWKTTNELSKKQS